MNTEKKIQKLFIILEKRNNIRKHIWKLCLGGVITTDPFEILEAERNFYENLYKSRRDCSENKKFCLKTYLFQHSQVNRSMMVKDQ